MARAALKKKEAPLLKRVALRFLLVLLAGFLLYQGQYLYRVCRLADRAPRESALMAARRQEMKEAGAPVRINHHWIPLAHISRHLRRAVIEAEDARFYSHHGFDGEGIRIALRKCIRERGFVAGGSTITQQLAKNLFLSAERTPWRKVQEAIIALMMEVTLKKDRILELYLNVIEWGNGVFGAEAAARHYFHKSAVHLSTWEAARLAAMVPNPRYYDHHRTTRYLKQSTNTILHRMAVQKKE